MIGHPAVAARLRGRDRASLPVRLAAGVFVLILAGSLVPGVSAQLPAGTTNAVLSYVDAAGGHVSIVRHWRGPGTGEGTQVVPFTPYFWDGCLPFQSGALMVLVTSPIGYPPSGLTSAEAYAAQYIGRIGRASAIALSWVRPNCLPASLRHARTSNSLRLH